MVRTISYLRQQDARKPAAFGSPTSVLADVAPTYTASLSHPSKTLPPSATTTAASTTTATASYPSSVLPRSHHIHSVSKSSNAATTAIPSVSLDVSAPSIPLQKCPPFCTFSPAHTREHFRDFSGVFTIHRLILFAWIVTGVSALLTLRAYLFPPTLKPSLYQGAWFAHPALHILLFLPILHYALSFVGALLFRVPTRLDDVSPIPYPVVWRIVSRGFNRECLLETIERCRQEMRRNPMFPYLVEIITDGDKFVAPNDADVLHLKVPKGYESPNGTKFKARALHYACLHSLVPAHAWVVHLDEETRPTSSGVKGITAFIAQCEREREYKRIGQGIILYHRSWKSYPILTMADMARTGEDVGQFYVQSLLGTPIIGLHGAYIVCRAGEEAGIGFDVGAEGSITEDCWWVFLARAQGFRLRWVDGYLEEQSTESFSDFLKQRRRWMVGLLKVMRHHPTSLRYRGAFIFLMAKWIASPFLLPVQLAYVVTLVVHRIDVPLWVTLLSFFNMTMVFYPYLVGWWMNLREGMKVRWYRVPGWTMVLILLTPAFQLLELAALILSFFSRWSKTAQGFHVVEKSNHADGKEGGGLPGSKPKDDMV